MKRWLLGLLIMHVIPTAAQINLTGGGIASEDFNALGTSATATLPANWKVAKSTTVRTTNFTYAGGTTAVERDGGNNLSNSAGNGIYRYNANGLTNESAVGGLSSSNDSKSVMVMAAYRNSGSSNISRISISYNAEKYRNGTNTAGFSVFMYYSTDGTNWTNMGTTFQTAFSGPDGNSNGYNPTPGLTVSKKGIYEPAVPVAANSSFYLCWQYSVTTGTTTSNAQALGVDDIVVGAPLVYYNKAGSDVSDFANWGVNTDGSGANPTNFEADGQIFNVTNTAASFGNTKLISGAATELNVGNGTTPVTFTINNGVTLTLGTAPIVKIAAKGVINAVGTANFSGNILSIESNINGSGAVMGNIDNATSTSVKRYIPAKATRKSVFLASPIIKPVAASWQDSIHVTGPGSGGSSCTPNSTTGNATANSNGFDATQTNNPSMFQYSTIGIGNGWQSIPSTVGTSLQPGTGYRVLVRGPRTQGCTLLSGAAGGTAQNAVTLSATGTLTTGNAAIPAISSGDFQLVGNPYASSISFNGVYGSNTANLAVKGYWIYDPAKEASTVPGATYAIYNDGTWSGTGQPAGITDGNIIASGQAFFIRRSATAGTGALSNFFQPVHQTATAHNGAFRNASGNSNGWQKLMRLQLASAATVVDGAVIRFSNDNNIDNQTINALDMPLFGAGTTGLSSFKAGQPMSIQTRRLPVSDTVALRFTAAAAGTYQLIYSEQIDMAGIDVFLRDKFLGTQQLLTYGQPLTVTVTADPASQGDGRFELIFRTSATLAARFISVSGERGAGSNAVVKFTAQEDGNVKTFAMERSTDGSRFEVVASLKGSDRAGQFSYVAEDGSINSSVVYYRIKANNANGTADYSQVIRLSSKAAISMTMSPNPARDVVTLKAEGLSSKATVRFTDASGRVVLSQPLSITGSGTQRLSVSSLAQGIYQVLVVSESGETLSTQKLIKL